MRTLPPLESNMTNDLVNIAHDALHDDGRIFALGFLEQFCEGGLAAIFVLDGIHLAFDRDDVFRQAEQFLQEVDAMQLALLVAVLEVFQTFGKGFELGVMDMLA